MTKIPTTIDGAFLIKPNVFKDERGFFLESWNKNTYRDIGISYDFVQDNHSKSSKNVLRGLHYQVGDAAQGKLVWVTSGQVFDVFVDLRKNSPTFGLWDGYYLDDIAHCRLWVPPGCAHGFVVLSETVDFQYKCTNYYNSEADRTLLWNDDTLKIHWPGSLQDPVLSIKDKAGISFKDCEKYECIF